MKKITILL